MTIPVLLLVAPPPSASATVYIPADLGDLVHEADLIVSGRVLDVRPEWVDGRRRVRSIVTLEVDEAMKGAVGSTVRFAVPGGRIGRYRSVLVGAPEFDRGDEVVLFLRADGQAVPHPVGLGQGVFRVSGDERTGERRVLAPVVPEAGSTPVRIVRGDPGRRPPTLREFRESVTRLIRERASRPGAPRE